ncbi:MAG: hypothetical protein HYU83_03500 [Chloroflexi bacterium]|nr:hypothetical protein [Chloroflexota bacterium]
MKSKKILILVDNKIRDLAGLVYLKVLLNERYHYDVLLANIEFAGVITVYRPHLMLMPQSRVMTVKSSLVRRARLIGSYTAVLPTEGIVANEETGALLTGKYGDPDNTPDINFLWGNGMRDILSKHKGALLERTFVCGNPRFDFYAPPLLSLLPSKAELCRRYGMNDRHKIVFWATSYPYANRDKADALNDLRNGNLDKAIDIDAFLEYTNLSQRLAIEAVFKLADRHKDVDFIIKPHPFERIRPRNIYLDYRDKVNLQNIFLAEDEPAGNLLNISDILLHSGSTTSVEAWLLGKPTVSLEMVKPEHRTYNELLHGGDEVSSAEELAKAVSHYLNGGKVPEAMLQARKKFIDRWFYSADGKSAERCASALNDFLEKRPNQPRFIPSLVVRYYLNGVYNYFMNLLLTLDTELRGGEEKRRKYFMDRELRRKRTFSRKEATELERSVRKALGNAL